MCTDCQNSYSVGQHQNNYFGNEESCTREVYLYVSSCWFNPDSNFDTTRCLSKILQLVRSFWSEWRNSDARHTIMAKYLIQIIVLGTQAVGKAFARAVRQEYQVIVSHNLWRISICYIKFLSRGDNIYEIISVCPSVFDLTAGDICGWHTLDTKPKFV